MRLFTARPVTSTTCRFTLPLFGRLKSIRAVPAEDRVTATWYGLVTTGVSWMTGPLGRKSFAVFATTGAAVTAASFAQYTSSAWLPVVRLSHQTTEKIPSDPTLTPS